MDSITVVLGGVFLGLSSAALLLVNGRIAGNSGIAGGLLGVTPGDAGWRWSWIAGLISGGALLALLRPVSFAVSAPRAASTIILAGLLVGFGTRLGQGCPSGHGLCGTARLSKRSILATMTFTATAAMTFALVEYGLRS